MDEDTDQLARFKEAVDRKAAAAEEASHHPAQGPTAPSAVQGDQPSLEETGRTQDVFSARDKNSGHKKKTADKWNQ